MKIVTAELHHLKNLNKDLTFMTKVLDDLTKTILNQIYPLLLCHFEFNNELQINKFYFPIIIRNTITSKNL